MLFWSPVQPLGKSNYEAKGSDWTPLKTNKKKTKTNNDKKKKKEGKKERKKKRERERETEDR